MFKAPSNSVRDVVKRAMASGNRSDGRKALDMRQLEVSPSENGRSVVVKLGKTQVLCTIRAAVTEPHPARQNEGKLEFKTDLSVMSHSPWLAKSLKQVSNRTAHLLDRTIKRSKLRNPANAQHNFSFPSHDLDFPNILYYNLTNMHNLMEEYICNIISIHYYHKAQSTKLK